MIQLSSLIPNADNPRTIKDVKFAQLVENLRKYPKFLEKRPIIIKSLKDKTIKSKRGKYRLFIINEADSVPNSLFNSIQNLAKISEMNI
jgi:hypothetical protein